MPCFRQGFHQTCQGYDAAFHIPVQLLKQGPVCLRSQQALFDLSLLPQQRIGCLQASLDILDLLPQPVELGEVLLPHRHTAADGQPVELCISVPQQRLLRVRAQPLPDEARNRPYPAGGQHCAAVLIQQRQTNGRGSKQALVLRVDRNQPCVEYRFKKQNGNHADADRQITFPRQRHPADIGSEIGKQPPTEQQRK